MDKEPMWGRIKMPTCPFCLKEHRLNATFCPSCGAQLLNVTSREQMPSIQCPQCGTANRGRATFCSNCGGNLFAKKESPKNTRQKTQESPKTKKPNIKPLDVAVIKKLNIDYHYLTLIESGKINTLLPNEVEALAKKIFGSNVTPATIKKTYRVFARGLHPDNNQESLTPKIDERIFNIGTIVKDEYLERMK